ncbi:MAG: ribokinase [Anaerolineales bacterium]
MTKITVIGSANVDLVARVPYIPEPGETIIGADFMQAMGGKGANQAVAAARLGGDVTFVARVGSDAFGEACILAYSAAGIATHGVLRTTGMTTGIALIGVADNGENSIIVVPGANHALSPADIDAQAEAIQSADVVLLQLETPLETVQRAVDIAYAAGRTIILNPAPYQPLPRALLEKISVLTPNLTEAGQLLGDALYEDSMMAQSLLGLGAQSVVMTEGANGAQVAGSLGHVKVPAYPVQAVDSTGAGDAFNAALGLALAEGRSLHQAAEFAAAAAALSVTKIGAQPSLPTRADVDAFLNRQTTA